MNAFDCENLGDSRAGETGTIRITGGNFRLFELLIQIERITEINNSISKSFT
jgi:hypothetical protein